MVKAAKANNQLGMRQLMNLACAKLTGLEGVYQGPEKYTSSVKLAIINMQVQLDYKLKCEVATNTVV